MKRLLRWKRLRWFAAGAVVRFVLRRSASRSIDQATAGIEERLPDPVRRALDKVPADPARLGGSAVVAARTARRVATGSKRASQVANDRRQRLADGIDRIRSVGDEIATERDRSARELKARYLRATDRTGAADDALLDLRPHHFSAEDGEFAESEQGDFADADELPTVKDPVRSGRWRADLRQKSALVNRAKRSYRPQTRPWDN